MDTSKLLIQLWLLTVAIAVCSLVNVSQAQPYQWQSQQNRATPYMGIGGNASHMVTELEVHLIDPRVPMAHKALHPPKDLPTCALLQANDNVTLSLEPKTDDMEVVQEIGVEPSGFHLQHSDIYCIYASIQFWFKPPTSGDLRITLVQVTNNQVPRILIQEIIPCCPEYTIRLAIVVALQIDDKVQFAVSNWSLDYILYDRKLTFFGLWGNANHAQMPCL